MAILSQNLFENLQVIDIGIDIEHVKRFQNCRKDDRFLKNNFTKKEIEYCFAHTLPEIHLTGFFCVKEAIRKTVSGSIKLKDIEVVHNSVGKPGVRVRRYSKNEVFEISISHTVDIAVAIGLRMKNDRVGRIKTKN